MPRNYAIENEPVNPNKKQVRTVSDTDKSTVDTKSNGDVIVYSSPFCPYCIKLKEELRKHNLLDNVIIVEDESMFPNYVKSLPYTVHTKTDEKFLGFPQNFEVYKKKFFS